MTQENRKRNDNIELDEKVTSFDNQGESKCLQRCFLVGIIVLWILFCPIMCCVTIFIIRKCSKGSDKQPPSVEGICTGSPRPNSNFPLQPPNPPHPKKSNT